MYWNIDEEDKDIIAAIDENSSISFGEAKESAIELEKKIHGRSLILILSENSVGSYLGYFCFTELQYAVLVLETGIKEEYCKEIIEKYKPSYLWAKEDWGKKLELDSLYMKYGFYLYRTKYESYDMNEDVGVILSTSGSTGSVKCVQLGYKGIKEHTKALADAIGFQRTDSAITTMPMAFVYGLSFVNIHIYKRTTLLLTTRGIMDKEFWIFFHQYKPTCISGLTIHYEMLSMMKFFEHDCEHMRIFTQGGDKFASKVKEKVKKYCDEFNKNCYVLYGQTETSGTCGCLELREDREINCIGKAISSGKFLLKNTEESIDMIGELVYAGNCAMLSYITSSNDLKKSIVNDRTVDTGDIVRKDKDGYFYILGRKKRIIKLFGKRTNLDDIENYIMFHYVIEECACLGEDEQLKVFVVWKSKNDESLQKDLSKFLQIKESMIQIQSIKKLPRNESGKILYSKL